MPLYEYRCTQCKNTLEVLQSISAPPLTKCTHCDGDLEKLLSVSSFQFKGSGWYITDYKNKSARSESSEKQTGVAGDTKSCTSECTK